MKRLATLFPLDNHDRFFNDWSCAHHPLDHTDSRDHRLIHSKITAHNFQCGRTGYRRDGLLEGSQYMNVRRPDGHGGQNTQGHSRDTEQGAKRPLEAMGADQGDIKHKWYSHLSPGRETNRTNHGG